MRWLIGCLVSFTVALPAAAAEVSSFELDNGLEIVVLEDHRAPLVVHMVWYRVGSRPTNRAGRQASRISSNT
jgi:zinc protease